LRNEKRYLFIYVFYGNDVDVLFLRLLSIRIFLLLVLKTFDNVNRAHVLKIAHMLAKIAHCVLIFVFVKRFQALETNFIKKYT